MGIWDDFFEKAKTFFGNDEETQARKKCYYELLEVPRDAGDDEIRRSYRKLALKYHPDKVEPERREECTAYFVLLQQAYEVLSDPQERAFYDKHRENIIRGSDPEERKDTGIVLYPFFQKCFIGFGDDPDGFYTVYRKLFDHLASEEYPYIEDEEDREFPSFGYEKSDFEDVVGPFYSYWGNFCTKRSFAWLDRYDLKQAGDRYTLKSMEKENKRIRDGGRKGRDEDIRRLVAYVRKRDKRVEKYRAEVEERKQKELDRVEQERRRQIKENLDRLRDHEVAHNNEDHMEDLEKIENELDQQFGALDCDDDGTECYCIVCEKKFKTAKSYRNHEKSKKHKQALEDLKRYMNEDDQQLFQHAQVDEEQEEDVELEEQKVKKKRKGKTGAKSPDDICDAEKVEEKPVEEPVQVEEEVAAQDDAKKTDKKKQKKAKKPAAKPAGGQTQPIEASCKVCGQDFASRSKLFNHIKESGHAALKEDARPAKSGRRK